MDETLPLQSLTLGQILDSTVEKYPDNPAIVYVDRDFRLTYSQFATQVDEIAKGLMALGVKKGE
ncbi:MAG: AMP-binding protein, partial [Desulfobacterales bacterium]|nr:AMP-binding protein [Desulfobacterales bacterium]